MIEIDVFADLSEKQVQALLALLTEPTQQAAAEKAGVGTMTIYRWLRDESFRRALMVLRRETLAQSLGRLQAHGNEAVEALVDLMHADSEPGSVRLGAAKALLDMLTKSVELENQIELEISLRAKVMTLEEFRRDLGLIVQGQLPDGGSEDKEATE